MDSDRQDIVPHSDAARTANGEQPQWLQDRLEWFRDLKLGLFLHWGPYCQWDCCESWPLVPADTWARPDGLREWERTGRDIEQFQQEYWDLSRTFNPVNFNPDEWAEAARQAGMRYVTFTAKHHDGFCMFDTRTTDYRVTHPDCPHHAHAFANVTREVFDAFRMRGLATSCYFSKSDWHSPDYWSLDFPIVDRNPNYDTTAHPERWEAFTAFVHEQVRELMTGYGQVDILWLDGGQVRPPLQDIRMDKLARMARAWQPGLIIADRTVGGPHENFITPEQTIPEEAVATPWESCVTMGTSWKYVTGEKFKPAGELIRMLADIVSKGGNLLLGFGPAPDGTFPKPALDRLADIGDWMAVNSRAIYGTRAIAPYAERNVRYTRRDDTVYGIVFPEAGYAQPPKKARLAALRPTPGTEVRLLGHDEPLAWEASGGDIVVSLPKNADDLPCDHAWVLEFEVD